jgi:hypothetical protein
LDRKVVVPRLQNQRSHAETSLGFASVFTKSAQAITPGRWQLASV